MVSMVNGQKNRKTNLCVAAHKVPEKLAQPDPFLGGKRGKRARGKPGFGGKKTRWQNAVRENRVRMMSKSLHPQDVNRV